MLRKMVFIVVFIFSLISYAGDIPRVILHQGYLTDTNGNPVNGNLNISFGIYETQSGGTAILEEDIGSVSVKDGFYALEIGKNSNLYSVFSDKNSLFLEVRINNEALSPRQRIGAVPFAFVSYDVVGDIHPTSITIGGKKIIDENGKWSGDSSSIPGVKSITALSPLTGGTITDTGSIGIPKAGDGTDGYLSKEDYLLFAGKQNRITGFCNPGTCVTKINEDGTVVCDLCGGGGGSVSISAGIGIVVDPNPIIGVGTISIDKTYFDNLYIQQGQPSSVTESMIADNAVSKNKLNSSGCVNGQILKFSGATGKWECAADEVSGGGGSVNISGGNGISVTPDPITSSGTISLTSAYQDGSAYDSRFVNENQPGSITSAMIAGGSVGDSHIAVSSVNINKLAQSGCTNGQTIKYNDIAGNWVCANDNNSGGTVTSVTASAPLSSSGGTTPNISLTGVIPITNGGTGSSTQNFVDLSTAQTIGGAKTFSVAPSAPSYVSTVSTGTAPFSIASTTLVANLNADMLDGQHASSFASSSHTHSGADITSGTISDARLSSNVSLLGNSIESSEITDGTILFADIGANTCTANQIMKRNATNTAWICSDDANSGGTVTSIQTGTGLTGGPITTSGTISLSSAYQDGSAYDSRFVNENQANSITSAMITDGTITGSDIANSTITLSKLAKSGCSSGQVVKYYVEQPGVEYFMCDTDLGITSCNTCDSTFVNENQANSITSSMITDGTITNSDLSAGSYTNITGVGTLDTLTVSGNTYLATTSGSVGIGTSAPSSKLHLYSTGSTAGNVALRLQYNFTGPVNGTRSSDWTIYATTSLGSFGISNTSGTQIFISGEDNNVGIGNTVPVQKLDVSGNIRASGQLISAVATGTAPLTVSSTTQVANLNADMVDSWHAAVILTGVPEGLYGTNQTSWVELNKWAVDFDSIPGNTLRALGFISSSAGTIAGRIRFLVNGTQVGSDCTFTATTTNTALNCPVITYTKPTGVGQIRIEIRRDTVGTEYVYYGQNTMVLK